jgi:predicted GIY-YIG superfamily endonuclease
MANPARAKTPRLTHNVYVVELDREVWTVARFRRRNPGYVEGKPMVYVGSTGLPVEQRFANHQRGYRSNVYVFRYGTRLLPDLFAHFNPMPYAAALEMERDLAEDLRRQGYAVWQA